ncbi:MAG: hypothetical protein BMS9Abin28_0108 [Anaerolineae bacterium]|nr:MAG: hypothetical protein BMS9Abin28_0108 [Anaerolineae bacterium]
MGDTVAPCDWPLASSRVRKTTPGQAGLLFELRDLLLHPRQLLSTRARQGRSGGVRRMVDRMDPEDGGNESLAFSFPDATLR